MQPKSELVVAQFRRLRRVIDDLGALQPLAVPAREEVFRTVQRHRHAAQQVRPAGADRLVIGAQRRAEFGHALRPIVGPAQGLAGDDIGVVLRQLQAHREEFLVVRFLRLVHHGVAEGVEAAVPRVDRHLALALQRQGEEGAGLCDGLGDHRRRDAVVGHVEEPHAGAGRPDRGRGTGYRGAVALADAIEIDDRDRADAFRWQGFHSPGSLPPFLRTAQRWLRHAAHRKQVYTANTLWQQCARGLICACSTPRVKTAAPVRHAGIVRCW
jgi:hypothetical protein